MRKAMKQTARKTYHSILLLASVAFTLTAIAQQSAPPDFSSIDRIMSKALEADTLPGAVVVIGHDGKVVFP